MDISQVKRCLGKKVIYQNTENLLTACTIRQDENTNFFYQAELQDLSAVHSVVICKLDEIEQEK